MSPEMNTVDRVKQCRTPQEALLVLAEAIDELALATPPDPWEQPLVWLPGEYLAPPPDNRAVVEGDDVIVKPVSQERQYERSAFAEVNRLHEYYGPGLSKVAFLDAYAKGGPRWLYYTARSCVMQMPLELRRALVADVELDSTSEAQEISRDILKFDESVPEGTQIEMAKRELGPTA